MPSEDESPSALRQKLEDANKRNKQLEERLTITEAGLSHLTDRQRKTILREMREDGEEITADNFKKVAKELGWGEAPNTETEPAPETPNQPNQNGQQNGTQQDGEQRLGMIQLGDGTWAPPEELMRLAMAAQMQMQGGMQGKTDDGTVMTPELFAQKLQQIRHEHRNSPTDVGQAAVMRHIQQFGHVAGIMDGSLVE